MTFTPRSPVITGKGMYVPEEILSNEDIAGIVNPERLAEWIAGNRWCHDRSEQLRGDLRYGNLTCEERARSLFIEYVEERIGIKRRHVVDRQGVLAGKPPAGQVFGSDLGAHAARQALAAADLEPQDVDLIICGTSSPDRIYPSTAVEIQARIGAEQAYAYDLLAACSSFVYGLHAAWGLIASGACRRALVITAEYFSCGVDYSDPHNCFFWGDAAAAVVLEAAEEARVEPLYELLDIRCLSKPSDNIRTGLGGTRPFVSRSHLSNGNGNGNGNGHGNGHRNGHGPGEPAYPYFFQNGPAVYREVVPLAVRATRDILERNGLATDDVRMFMFHQASRLLIEGIAKRLVGEDCPPDRVPMNLEEYGNTSSCGVALCLVQESVLQPGEIACMTSFGAGYTVGTGLLRKLSPAH